MYNTFLLNSTSEADYFNKDNMFALSDFSDLAPKSKVAISVSGKVQSSKPLSVYKQMEIYKEQQNQGNTHTHG